jgi:hypothetical protein
MRRTAGYTELDVKRYEIILEENMKMENNRIPKQIIAYKPKGKWSLVMPLKSWCETITAHIEGGDKLKTWRRLVVCGTDYISLYLWTVTNVCDFMKCYTHNRQLKLLMIEILIAEYA